MKIWALAVVGCGCFSAARHQGPPSDHFDGERFFTPGAPRPKRGLIDFFKWQLSAAPGPWAPYREALPGPPPPRRVGLGQLRVTFINHASTLIQLDGVNVLTDPVYSERVSPVSFAGPKRVRPPGIRFEDLPPIDAVVISHNHYDHMDLATLKRLQHAFPQVRIFAGLGNAAYLEQQGLRHLADLDWWQEAALVSGRVTLISVPVQHFSNRGLTDDEGTLWSGWVLSGSRGRTFFGGDTGYGPHFREIRERMGPFRLAVLPIGAYLPEWFMSPVHMSPGQAVQAKKDLQADVMVPMHYGTFPLADDGELAAPAALREASADSSIWILDFGEGRDVP